jgi:hypothetical protein
VLRPRFLEALDALSADDIVDYLLVKTSGNTHR